LAWAGGQHIRCAFLPCRKAGGDQQEFFKVTLSDLLVSSYQHGSGRGHVDATADDGSSEVMLGTPAAEMPILLERVSLNFSQIELEYKEQKQDGSLGAAVKTGWDLKANKKV